MKHAVIYVPGIGDTKTTFQELAVRTWKLWGVEPRTFPMRWADQEAFAPKFNRLLKYIDTLLSQGYKVSLVGASAGATVVLNAFAARHDINGIVLIAGKVNRPEAIGSWYHRNAPAFAESAFQAEQALADLKPEQRARITSRYGLIDIVVPRKDSIVPGAQNKSVIGVGHAPTIALQLTFGAPNHLRFLKRLAR